MILHHVHLRPTLDGSRVVDVTMDLTPEQLRAGAHAVREVKADRYRVATIEHVDDVLAMRELTGLADELDALALGDGIARLTLAVAGVGRLRAALEEFAESRSDGPLREGDAEALPHVYLMIDGVADAHAAVVRAALDDSVELPALTETAVRTTPARLAVIPVVVLGIVVLPGCGETRIDVAKGERMIFDAVSKQVQAEVKSVECPRGLIAKKGETFRCRVTATDGTFGDAIVTERDDRGSVSVDAPFLHVRDVETSVAEGIADEIGGGRVKVRCPDIVTVEAGGTFRCRARSGGERARIRVVQQDDQGRVRYEVLQ